MNLTKNQTEAVNAILSSREMETSLVGYAGTGKTTICSHIARNVDEEVVLLSPTWKAARVISEKTKRPATTIYSALYTGARIEDDELIFSNPSLERNKLYICDEASMINSSVYYDFLKQLREKDSRVLWVGDTGQLPPIGASISPALDKKPTARLTEILRTGANYNIALCANWIRERGIDVLRPFQRDSVNCVRVRNTPKDMNSDMYITPFNKIRVGYNNRKKRNRKLSYGDKLIMMESSHCKTFINSEIFSVEDFSRSRRLYKGREIYEVMDAEGRSIDLLDVFNELTIADVYKKYEIDPRKTRNFYVAFFADAISVHKSQGSEWDNIIADFRGLNKSRWARDTRLKTQIAYTAISRAKENCSIFIDF